MTAAASGRALINMLSTEYCEPVGPSLVSDRIRLILVRYVERTSLSDFRGYLPCKN